MHRKESKQNNVNPRHSTSMCSSILVELLLTCNNAQTQFVELELKM